MLVQPLVGEIAAILPANRKSEQAEKAAFRATAPATGVAVKQNMSPQAALPPSSFPASSGV